MHFLVFVYFYILPLPKLRLLFTFSESLKALNKLFHFFFFNQIILATLFNNALSIKTYLIY